MKINGRIISTIMLAVVTAGVLALAVNSGSTAENGKNYQSQDAALRAVADELMAAMPECIYSGIYFDENGNITVNVTDVARLKRNYSAASVGDVKIFYNEVELTLSALERAKTALIPHMLDYNIATLGANVMTNMLDVELYSNDSRAKELLAGIIDLNHVNITVLPEDVTLKFAVN